MPITSDGKEPDLDPFLAGIADAIGKAVRKARREHGGGDRSEKLTQKDVVLANLDAAIAAASGDGEFLFSERQVYYQLREPVMNATGQELSIGHFKRIITDYEHEHREIKGMYREPRGSIYHPHRPGEELALGTLMVADYERPEWTFHHLIYLEKEGFSEALKAVRWPERHDCALMSSKGFSTRAARDLVDKLAMHAEPVTIFCVHDADASGTMIYQTFQEATKARAARKIKIANLGLEPWEAVAMGLQVETVPAGDQRKAAADYVRARRDRHWVDWLQTHRVELNAMTTPQFIAWLDAKMKKHGAGKLIPPPNVIESELVERVEDKVRAAVTERILRDGRLEDQVSAAIKAIKMPSGDALSKGIARMFKRASEREWRDHVEEVATERTKRV
jgi:hypothetical protein